MAKQLAEYKNCDNPETNILPYIDVYIRIRLRQSRILPAASEELCRDRPTFGAFTSSRLLKGILVVSDAAANPSLARGERSEERLRQGVDERSYGLPHRP
jgi:hypothetical protein